MNLLMHVSLLPVGTRFQGPAYLCHASGGELKFLLLLNFSLEYHTRPEAAKLSMIGVLTKV